MKLEQIDQRSFPKGSMDDFIADAYSDPKAREVAEWVRYTNEKIEDGGSYASDCELEDKRVTKLTDLYLRSSILAIPGGAASPFAVPLMEIVLDKAAERGETRPIDILMQIHGSCIPNEKDLLVEMEKEGRYLQGGLPLHMARLRAATGCGGTQGDTDKGILLLISNVAALKELASNKYPQLDVNIIPVISGVGGRDYSRKIEEIPAFGVHDIGDIRHSILNSSQESMSGETYDEFIGSLQRAGHIVVGEGCIDRRQRSSNFDWVAERTFVNGVAGKIRQTKESWYAFTWRMLHNGGQRASTGWSLVDHTENPVMILDTGDSLAITALKWKQFTTPGVIYHEWLVSPAAPGIINLPSEALNDPITVKAFGSQTRQLFANLNREVYGQDMGFGITAPMPSFYYEIDGQMVQLTDQGGLSLVCSPFVYDKLRDWTIPSWSTPNLEHDMLNPNPAISTWRKGPEKEFVRIANSI